MSKKIKSKKTYNCDCDPEGTITEKYLTHRTEFDELGNTIREEIFEEGEMIMLVENNYAGALLLKTQQTDYVNQMQQVWEYLYDANGRKIEQRELYEGGGYAAIRFEYDDKDNILSELFVDDEEAVSGKVQYTYDANGNLLDKTEFDGDDFTTYWLSTNYKYDDKNNVIEKNELFTEDPPKTTIYEYNKDGELDYAKVFYTDNNDLILEQTTLEDDDGNIIGMEILHHKQALKQESIIKKNDLGQLDEEEIFVNDVFKSKTKINYDKNGFPIEEKNLKVVGKDFMQWTAKAFELEFWKNEDEEE